MRRNAQQVSAIEERDAGNRRVLFHATIRHRLVIRRERSLERSTHRRAVRCVARRLPGASLFAQARECLKSDPTVIDVERDTLETPPPQRMEVHAVADNRRRAVPWMTTRTLHRLYNQAAPKVRGSELTSWNLAAAWGPHHHGGARLL